MESLINLQLLDADSGRLFSLKVTPAVAEKANTDMVFATNLLKSVMGQGGDGSVATSGTPATEITIGVDDSEKESRAGAEESRGQMSCMTHDGGAESSGQAEDDMFRWSHEAILLLVETFKEEQRKMTTGKISAKKFWERMADALGANGIAVTGPQCKSKINGLKKTYRSVKDHNRRSGNSRRTWVYLEILDSLFEKEPWMAPVRAVDTATIADEESMLSSPSTSSGNGRRRRPSVEAVLEALQASREQRAAMHAEAMAKQDRLFAFLSGLKKN